MTAAQLDDAEGHALVAAIHERKQSRAKEPKLCAGTAKPVDITTATKTAPR